MSARPRRYLMAMWDGGGNAAPQLGVGRRLVERGHQVHVLGDRALAGEAEAAGCTFTPGAEARSGRRWTLRRHPQRLGNRGAARRGAGHPRSAAVRHRRGLRRRHGRGHQTFQPDAVVPDSQLFGAMIAAEEAGLPVAALVPNLWMAPTPGTGDPGVFKIIDRWSKRVCPISMRPGPSTDCRRSPTSTTNCWPRTGSLCSAVRRSMRVALPPGQRAVRRPHSRRPRVDRTVDVALAREQQGSTGAGGIQHHLPEPGIPAAAGR